MPRHEYFEDKPPEMRPSTPEERQEPPAYNPPPWVQPRPIYMVDLSRVHGIERKLTSIVLLLIWILTLLLGVIGNLVVIDLFK